MREFTPDEIRLAVHGRWLTHGADVTVDGVTIDSRTARPGDMFIAIKGDRHDGHDHLIDAARAGCIAAVVQRDRPIANDVADLYGGGVIGVEDTVTALGELARFYRQQTPASVIAVTGSAGKTTVKRMIHHVLSQRQRGSASPKSFNNAIGVPLTLLAINPTDDYVVCEVGANAPGEILSLARIAQPDLGVITMVGPAHLEGFGSVEKIAMEKASLLAALSSDGIAVVRGGQHVLDRALMAYECRRIRFGDHDDCELRLTGYEPRGTGQRFQINDRLWVRLPLLGRHNAMNALAAVAVAQRSGFTQEDAAAALADMPPVEMRLEQINAGSVTIVNDAYNANPASVLAATETLGDIPGRRRVVMIGDMLELGEDSESLHRHVGEQMAACGVDLLIGIGPLGRYIAQAAAGANVRSVEMNSVEAAQEAVVEQLLPGDVVLIKGSRGMAMERLIEPIRDAFA
ncbi:MAG: UDP-N-acetylmuramoyl-tripeptide--D-alanyl-D-alanine ligase [Planctomycetota bacterium]|jgi:UDP-N-acetylmuramoyl-tripeptide--D-alanyl-D-alanine ligase